MAADDCDVKELREAVAARWAAHDREQVLRDEALKTARETIDVRLEGMNELRAQINSERGRFIERQAFDTFKDSMATQLHANAVRLSSLESRLTTIAAVAAFLVPVVIFAVNFLFNE